MSNSSFTYNPISSKLISHQFIPVGEMITRTTNGAAATTRELATNDIMLDSFAFDTATEEGVGFWINFGNFWDSATPIKARFHWTAQSGSGGVAWGIAARSYGDSDAIDQAPGTQVIVTDTLITADDIHISDASGNITVTGADPLEPVYFSITREVGDGADTLGVDAELIGVSIEFTQNISIFGGGSLEHFTIPADAFISRVTNGPNLAARELGTNDIQISAYNFDASTEEGIGCWLNLGNTWDAGTIKCKANWTASSGSGTVKWDFAARGYGDDDALDQALGTEQSVTDTLITVDDVHVTNATPSITIANAVADELVYLQVTRDTANDTLAADAELLSVTVEFSSTGSAPIQW